VYYTVERNREGKEEKEGEAEKEEDWLILIK